MPEGLINNSKANISCLLQKNNHSWRFDCNCIFSDFFLGWPYSSGFINDTMIKDHMPAPGPDTQILMCGPPPMINFACIPNLEKLGYTPDMYFPF